MNIFIAASIIILTMPLNYENGNFLPLDQKMAVVIWEANTVQPVGAAVAYAGQEVTISVPGNYGTWFAVAWTMDVNTQRPVASSVPSVSVTKKQPVCGTYCHESLPSNIVSVER